MFNPFHHSLSEVQKMLVALVYLGGMVALLLINGYDETFTQACVILVGAVFGVIGVFAAKNHTPDDVQKALEQAKAAIFTVVGYFIVLPTDTTEKWALIIASIAAVWGVYEAQNRPRRAARS